MKTLELYNTKSILSFEIFPPQGSDPLTAIHNTVQKLKELNPDFISVTYSAGKSENKANTFEIASVIKNHYGIESVAHLPGLHLSKRAVLKILDYCKCSGIENILALRGDTNPALTPHNDFRYASDLISFIKENGDFNIIGACYPEGHIESPTIIEDIRNLKNKVDAGADQLITQ